MNKKLKSLLLILIILPCMLLFSACNEDFVKDIEKSSTLGNTDTYTITYSDGSTSLITVENGEDGVDGSGLTLNDIKAYCDENDLDFKTFLQEYFNVQTSQDSIKSATNKALQSTVDVFCEFNLNSSVALSSGAGVIYKMGTTYSYIITNYHVCYYTSSTTANRISNKIKIYQYGTSETAQISTRTVNALQNETYVYYGEGSVDATYIGGSMIYDLAILKVNTNDLLAINPTARAVTIADIYSAADTAIAIGNPEGAGTSVTVGHVSKEYYSLTMKLADETTTGSFRVIQIDAAVNSGNSGGGLFNIKGELIGIVNAKIVDSEIENIAYALPCDNVTKVAENILYYYNNSSDSSPVSVKQLWLDITYSTTNAHQVYNEAEDEITLYNEFKITSVTQNSTVNSGNSGFGYLIGLQENDIITKITINDTVYNITRAYQVGDLMLTVHAGDKIMFTVKRGNTTVNCGYTNESGIPEAYLSTRQ